MEKRKTIEENVERKEIKRGKMAQRIIEEKVTTIET
jgi:hypothetical protein